MQNNKTDLMIEVSECYVNKLGVHREVPRGADWNGEEGQTLLFGALCKIVDTVNDFSINDLGCGYSALYDFLVAECDELSYLGVDISQGMIKAAERSYKEQPQACFAPSGEPNQLDNFSVASDYGKIFMPDSNNLYLFNPAKTKWIDINVCLVVGE
jgi:SAM-dependent methyltransferase